MTNPFQSLSSEEVQVLKNLLRETASNDEVRAQDAMHKFTKAVELPIRKAFFIGDTVGSIFQREDLDPDAAPKYPLDFVGPSGERDFAAFFLPDEGTIPERRIQGDEITVDTFNLGNAIDWDLRYARVARWPLVSRALRVFRDGFTMKVNDEGWRVLVGAGVGRQDKVVSTSGTTTFQLGLVSKMQLDMKRGIEFGMSKLTDLYVAPEAMFDIRNFATNQSLDFLTRRDIFLAAPTQDENGNESTLSTIYGTRMHELAQLGLGRDYTTYFNQQNDALGNPVTSLTASQYLVVGLDLTIDGRDAFWMPMRRDLEMFNDPTLHRKQKAGVYGWMELNFVCLDNRRVLHGKY
jgi:hypothetical protein